MKIGSLACFITCFMTVQQSVVAEDIAEVQAGKRFTFCWNAYRALKVKSGRNVLISPNRIRSALVQLVLGSTGATRDEILKITDQSSETNLTVMYKAYYDEKVKLTSEPEMRFEIAAQFFVADTIYEKINSDFANSLDQYFNVKLMSTSFATNPDDTLKTIDDFVAENTHGEIPHFLVKDLPVDTKVVLVNAIFMLAKWTTAFNENDTAKSVFHAESGDVQTDFMQLSRGTTLPYAECANKGCQLVVLPFTKDKKYVMVIVLPNESATLNSWEDAMDPKELRRIWKNATDEKVHLKMPKFTLNKHISLQTMLTNLGATHIFGEAGAINSRIFTENVGVLVDDIIHAAKLIVKEEGSTPASAIALAGDEDIKSVHLTRTFLFFIADVSNGIILYWGRVADPTKSK